MSKKGFKYDTEQLIEDWKKKLVDLEEEFDKKREEFEDSFDETGLGEDSSVDIDIERLDGYITCLREHIKDLEGLAK